MFLGQAFRRGPCCAKGFVCLKWVALNFRNNVAFSSWTEDRFYIAEYAIFVSMICFDWGKHGSTEMVCRSRERFCPLDCFAADYRRVIPPVALRAHWQMQILMSLRQEVRLVGLRWQLRTGLDKERGVEAGFLFVCAGKCLSCHTLEVRSIMGILIHFWGVIRMRITNTFHRTFCETSRHF